MVPRRLKRPVVATDAADIVLGDTYTDLITGIKGTAIFVNIHLTGCDQVCLEYVEGGKRTDIIVDATRIEEIVPQDNARSGGPARYVGSSHSISASGRST